MWQEILITEVTHMREDRVCIAGINHEGVVVRPLFCYPYLVRQDDLFLADGSVIRPRTVLRMNLEPMTGCEKPHTEDYLWSDVAQTRLLRWANDAVWKQFLIRTSAKSVEAVFETEILKHRTVRPGTGERSLGTVKPKTVFDFCFRLIEREGQERRDYRLSFYDAADECYAAVKINDLSLQAYADHLLRQGQTLEAVSATIQKQLKQRDLWLRLGLTRPFEGHCWLQITGIYTFPDYLKGRTFADFW